MPKHLVTNPVKPIKSVQPSHLLIFYMFKSVILLTLFALSLSALQFNYGPQTATPYGDYGKFRVPCHGGNGNLRYHYGNVPINWEIAGNFLIIPQILKLTGSYILKVRVQDEHNNVLDDFVKLSVKGMEIQVKHPSDRDQPTQEKKDYSLKHQQEENNNVDDKAKRNALLLRQKQAHQALANLLNRIHQLKIDAHDTKQLVKQYQAKNAATSEQQTNCQVQLNELKITIERAQVGLNQRSDEFQFLRAELSDKQNYEEDQQRLEELNSLNAAFEEQRPIKQAKFKAQKQTFDSCQVIHQGYHDDYDNINARLSQIEQEFNANDQKAFRIPFKVQQINLEIEETDALIQDLQQQIKAAEERKRDLINQRAQEEQQLAILNEVIRQLDEQAQKLNERLPSVIDGISIYHPMCGEMEENLKFVEQILEEEKLSYQSRKQEIEETKSFIQQRKVEVKELQGRVQTLQNQISVLQTQLKQLQGMESNQGEQCAALTQKLMKISSTLQTVTKKLETILNQISDAEAKLQAARAEKQLADAAVQEIIQSSTDANLYPDISKLLHPKTLTQKLAQKKSYPLSPLTMKALASDDNDDFHRPCQKYSPKVGIGRISSIGRGNLIIERETGQMMKLRVEDCTMLKTNKKNYKLEVNDPVEYEAGLNKNGELSLYNLAV